MWIESKQAYRAENRPGAEAETLAPVRRQHQARSVKKVGLSLLREWKMLTPKQQRFVSEYLKDLNGTQAAIRAGYSAKTANEQAAQLLAKLSVQEAVQKAMDKRQARTEITQDYVLNTIVETIERCKQAKPVTTKDGKPVMVENAEGELVAAYAYDSGAVLKGAELLGKHLKLFTDKTELTGANGGPVNMNWSIEFVSPKNEG